MAVEQDGDNIVERLEEYFRLSPSSSGLILPPDPAEHIWQPDGLIYGKAVRRAAVLVPVIPPASSNDDYRIMLTLRTSHLRSHAGQVSLPGGRADSTDRDIIHTALREAEEETYLAPEHIKVIGTLPALIMPSAYHVTPVVALIDPAAQVKAAPDEVAEIFYAPTSLLLNPDNYRINTMAFQGRERRFMELQYGSYRIWGATAAILHYLAKQLQHPGDAGSSSYGP